MDFMKREWEDESLTVTLVVKEYPVEGVAFETLKPIIHEIRENAKDMVIKVDLRDANLISVDRIRAIIKLCVDVTEYTRQDNILRQIQVLGAGIIFRVVYAPISVAIPKYFRDIIVFI
jgi:hypothetical protein